MLLVAAAGEPTRSVLLGSSDLGGHPCHAAHGGRQGRWRSRCPGSSPALVGVACGRGALTYVVATGIGERKKRRIVIRTCNQWHDG